MNRYAPPPELPALRQTVLPVFIPFAGCPGRCVYCAQHLQTRQAPVEHFAQIRDSLDATLQMAKNAGHRGAELAFYGGTFTLLPQAWQEELLSAVRPWQERGIIKNLRCSTRPDAVPDETLRRLKALGMTCIELGVQSFADAVLTASKRGYGGAEAEAACIRARAHGFALGVQLLPGLPGMADADFRADVARCLELAPDFVRLYPCLVLRDTPLAADWEGGHFQPWGRELTTRLLAEAMLLFQKVRIRVARVGLPLADGFAEAVLAGPAHPALGDMAQGLALYYWIKEQMENSPTPVRGLSVPRARQGTFWGQKGALKPAYAALGLSPEHVEFWNWPLFCFRS